MDDITITFTHDEAVAIAGAALAWSMHSRQPQDDSDPVLMAGVLKITGALVVS